MNDEQRAKLLHLAAKRGLKGFSALVQEALEQYLRARAGRDEEVQAALAVRGALKGKEGERFAEACRRTRENWR